MKSYDLVGTMNKIKKYQKDMNELEDKYEKVINYMKDQSIKKEDLKKNLIKKIMKQLNIKNNQMNN